MIKLFAIACGIVVMLIGNTLYASVVNYNQSVEWVKSPSRNASLDPDAAFFNPAGTAFMKEGLYLYLSSQSIYIPITINGSSLTKNSYNADLSAWFFPDFFLVYNKRKRKHNIAFSFGALVIGGGGSGIYNEGLQAIDVGIALMASTINVLYNSIGYGSPIGMLVKSKFVGSSDFYSLQSSMAISFLQNKLALSVGGRFIIANNSFEGRLWSNGAYGIYVPLSNHLEVTQLGYSYGLIFGLCARPNSDFVISLKGTYHGLLSMRVKAKDDFIFGIIEPGFKNGERKHDSLASLLATGFAYSGIKDIKISISYIYYFTQFAYCNGAEDSEAGDWELGIGYDHQISNLINIGCGYQYSQSNKRPSGRSQLDEGLSAHTAGFGISFDIKKNLRFTTAFGYTYFVPRNVNEGDKGLTNTFLFPAKFHEHAFNIGIGITWNAL